MQRALPRTANDERAHLQRAVEHPRLPEAGIGDVVIHRTIAAHRDSRRGRAFAFEHLLGPVDLAIVINVDEHDETRLPAALVCALSPIDRFAQVDSVATADRLRARARHRFRDVLRMIRESVGANPLVERGECHHGEQPRNRESDGDLDEGESSAAGHGQGARAMDGASVTVRAVPEESIGWPNWRSFGRRAIIVSRPVPDI